MAPDAESLPVWGGPISCCGVRGVSPMSPRAYQLGRRQEAVEQTRTRIVAATRDLLGVEVGFTGFTVDAVARKADVSRMTIYYQFDSKVGLLEALCDSLAATGGMRNMRTAMDDPDPLVSLSQFVVIFARFWGSARQVTRRLHAMAAMDADFEVVIRLRQERRRQHFEVLLPRISAQYGRPSAEAVGETVAIFYSLVSFEMFDNLAGPDQSFEQVAPIVHRLCLSAIDLPFE